MPWSSPSHSQRQRAQRGRTQNDREYEERRRRDPALALALKLRGSQRWKKVRAIKLARDPLCEDCRKHGRTEPATQVHHVEPLVQRPDLAFDPVNLMSLCTTCHARREGAERCGSGR